MQDMDAVLEQARTFAFAADAALKDAQRSICADGHSKHAETSALKAIRDDIWALEDKVRAAKWATSAAEKADLANQIDPLMLQVMGKCQQHRDRVRACQDLLRDIVGWCERGTKAYRFDVAPSAAAKGAPRYPSAAGGAEAAAQGKAVPASRIPAYKSPTKHPRAQGAQGQQQQQHQQQQQQQHPQQPWAKAGSRIPQPRLGRTGSPDAQQQQPAADQAGRSSELCGAAGSGSSSGGGPAQHAAAGAGAAGARQAGGAGAPAPHAPAAAGAALGDAAASWGSTSASQGGSNNGGAPLAASRSSGGGRVASRGLLQLEPSRDDVSLSSAGQRLMQQGAAGAGGSSALRSSQASMHDALSRALLARAPRASQTTADELAALDAAFGPTELGAVPSFTPLAGGGGGGHAHPHQRAGPFAPTPGGYAAGGSSSGGGGGAGEGGSSSGGGYASLSFGGAGGPAAAGATGGGAGGGFGVHSLRTSQEVSLMLRSGLVTQAALLSSNASRMHIVRDAVHYKPARSDPDVPEVPVVPPRLAVHKRRSVLGRVARAVAGTLVAAAVATAGVVAVKEAEEQGLLPGGRRHAAGGDGSDKQGRRGGRRRADKGQQPLEAAGAGRLPFAPLGPAPEASAGCG